MVIPPGIALDGYDDPDKIKPGLKGNLIFIVARERTVPAKEEGEKPTTSRQVIGMMPAVPFEVTGRR
ncbi:MAG: hypothetical protein U1E05_00395 [Patescibacteria group bacterium]|nr:hypothetical protein [Patescibacteria group bacterium]